MSWLPQPQCIHKCLEQKRPNKLFYENDIFHSWYNFQITQATCSVPNTHLFLQKLQSIAQVCSCIMDIHKKSIHGICYSCKESKQKKKHDSYCIVRVIGLKGIRCQSQKLLLLFFPAIKEYYKPHWAFSYSLKELLTPKYKLSGT